MRIDLNFLDLAKLWLAEGATTRSVAETLGVSTTVVRRNADYWQLPKLTHRLGGDASEEWNPTPDEIKAACERIQATWSPGSGWLATATLCSGSTATLGPGTSAGDRLGSRTLKACDAG